MMTAMARTDQADGMVSRAQRTRGRALIVPREHGAWGLLLVPLFTGVVASFPSHHQSWALALFTMAAVCMFWLRTPVEGFLGSGSITAHTPREKNTALLVAIGLGVAAAACLVALMWPGRNLKLLVIGAVAASSFIVQAVLRRLGRDTRMTSQLAGAVALTSTAPAAYYLGSGNLDERALALWTANWLFAWNQIHFVQLRLHTARIATFPEKLSRGKVFFSAQMLMLVALILASLRRWLPPLTIFAFLPILVRGTWWFFRGPTPLDIKKLGWSEMTHGAVFGILCAIAFLLS